MERILHTYTIPKSYHNFVDKRKFMGVNNAMNVLSNLFFLYPAIYLLMKQNKDDIATKTKFLALTIFGLAITSAYYHLKPTNHTIFMDMIFVVSLNTFVLSYFVDETLGYLMGILGVVSVVLWNVTNDIRPYALLQIGIALFCCYKLYETPAQGYILPILGVGISVRLVEMLDSQIYKLTNKLISGHTLKHILATIQIYIVIQALEKIDKI